MIAVSAGLNPCQDTPVEILHVLLLGFVKYLWRDWIQQLKGKDKKELLATRLSSFNVSGLGISPLAGKTLVQYSGSLTGWDFRAIAQVTPFVLYNLVSRDCFETWQALSKIIPLIWQPEINDIESAGLTSQNSTFFSTFPPTFAALDLPFCLRPRPLNLLMQLGLFVPSTPAGEISVDTPQGQQPRPQPAESAFIWDKFAWRTTSDGCKNLVSGRITVTHYLELDQKREPAAYKTAQRPINQTLTGQHIFSWSTKPGLFKTNMQLFLLNGDSCGPHSFVIVKHPHWAGETL
ncbi:hypothetical protein B0H14DRAFT_2629249 [Mycena olivaceomarginata]|nr:hypothetical protein B0H14DRAFT_2629249 [Mycena olivaceomarginata]